MANVAAPVIDWSVTPPQPFGARSLVQSTGYYPVAAAVQWNNITNTQLVEPSPGFSDLVASGGTGYSQ